VGRQRLVDRVDDLGPEPGRQQQPGQQPLAPADIGHQTGREPPAIQAASSWNRNLFILASSCPDRRPPPAPGTISPSSSGVGGGG
jgi:hypothetical protein